MRKLIPLLVVLLGAGGGVGAGMFLKPAPELCTPEDEGCEAVDEHGASDGKDAVPVAHESTEFAVLNKQFVIPIVKKERVVALVVSSLAIEVEEGTTEAIFELEPKLRDAFLQVLFIHAHSGGFDGTFTARQAMADLKARLVEAAAPIVGDTLADVLITEIVRQDL